MPIAAIFNEILSTFDTEPFRPLLEGNVYNKIHSCLPEGQKNFSTEELGELLAFRFIESNKEEVCDWGTYYQPYSIYRNEDGSKQEFPSLDQITAAILDYWGERSSTARHPVLLARYTGLLHDFCPKVKNESAHFLISKKYVAALLEIVNQNLYIVPAYAISKVKMALEVALSLNETNLIEQAKNAIISLENNIAICDKPGLWGFSFDLLIANKKKLVSETEETAIVETLENRLFEMMSADSWATEAAARRLASYFRRKNLPDQVERVLNHLDASYRTTIGDISSVQKAYCLERLYEYYKEFQLSEKAQIILNELRTVSKETDKEMKALLTSQDISKEDIDTYTDHFLQGDAKAIFTRLAFVHTPKIQDEKDALNKHYLVATMSFMMSKNLVDKKGRKIATIGPISEDPEGNLILHISNSLRMGTVLLHFLFEEGIKREVLTIHELLKFLHLSCIITKERFLIIEKAMTAYFVKDYLTFIHLLIPQFEEAIRQLVEMNGGTVLTYKNGSFSLKTLDHLLCDTIVRDVFGEDMSLYFRVLFSDKRGWNLRNNVAHGITDVDDFNKLTSDRLLHSFLCLGLIRLKEQ